MSEKMIVGSLESCSLPELELCNIEVRVDTGAKTSSLHVDNLKNITEGGKPWVTFDIHPDSHNVDDVIKCRHLLYDVRNIKSSNGASEKRYVIKTKLTLGDKTWPIEITLTDRSDMSYLMLLGRQGMSDFVLVDPSKTFLLNSDES